MRYITKFIGESTWAVIDTEAPDSVRGNQPQGHVLLSSRNGSQSVEISAIAMNIFNLLLKIKG